MNKLEGMEISNVDEEMIKSTEESAPATEDDRSDAALDSIATEEGVSDTPLADTENASTDDESGEPIDYEKIMREDLLELKSSFSELGGIDSITELPNPMRYAALRDLGLTAKEAYLATSERKAKDNRSHLSSAVPGGIGAPRCNMTRSELEGARELFPGLRDGELIGLYKKVNL